MNNNNNTNTNKIISSFQKQRTNSETTFHFLGVMLMVLNADMFLVGHVRQLNAYHHHYYMLLRPLTVKGKEGDDE